MGPLNWDHRSGRPEREHSWAVGTPARRSPLTLADDADGLSAGAGTGEAELALGQCSLAAAALHIANHVEQLALGEGAGGGAAGQAHLAARHARLLHAKPRRADGAPGAANLQLQAAPQDAAAVHQARGGHCKAGGEAGPRMHQSTRAEQVLNTACGQRARQGQGQPSLGLPLTRRCSDLVFSKLPWVGLIREAWQPCGAGEVGKGRLELAAPSEKQRRAVALVRRACAPAGQFTQCQYLWRGLFALLRRAECLQRADSTPPQTDAPSLVLRNGHSPDTSA